MTTPDLFAPSDYTAHLLLAARRHVAACRPARIMEIGVGSGVVLADLLNCGAGEAWGVDIEPQAVEAAQHLMGQLGLADRSHIERGQLWSTVSGERFDCVVANLPHFASEDTDDGIHLPTWSIGGSDGRRVVDPFLQGLAEHLAPKGVALMTHNVFIGLERTREVLRPLGLEAEVVLSASTVLSPSKLARMTPAVRSRCEGHSVHRVGPYAFVDFDVLRITWCDAVVDAAR